MTRRGRPPHPDVLTPREWEVLEFLRDGLSNEEIAGRLEISVPGVKFHVSEILGKLGLENRTDAANWRPDQPGPWWLAAGAPLLFWRRLRPSRLSNAVTGGLGVALAAGIGLLVWALLATGGGGGRNVPPPTVDGVPTTFLVLGHSFRPIDPATGLDLPGYDLLSVASEVSVAISPDGRTAAFAPPETSGSQQLSLFDLERWEVAGELRVSSRFLDLHWSPDGTRLYVRTEENCRPGEIDGFGVEVLFCEFWIKTVDVESGEVLSEAELPSGYASNASFLAGPKLTRLAPDGRTLYLFWNGNTGDPSVEGNTARIVAIDPETGEVRNELELPKVPWGGHSEQDRPGGPLEFLPAVAFSPDGHRAYIVHAEEERITVVDLEDMRIERSLGIGRRTSLFNRFLSVLANRALAKEDQPFPETSAPISPDGRAPFLEKWAAISPDGRYLYVSGWSERIIDQERTGFGLQVIDTDSLETVAQINTGRPHSAMLPLEDTYRSPALHPSGRYLYAIFEGDLHVLDPDTLEVIARRNGGRAVLFAPAPRPEAAAAP